MPIYALLCGAAVIASIAGYEGYSDVAYLDSAGVPTIGYGTTQGIKLGDTITREFATELLQRDATYAGEAIKRCVSVPLYQHEYDAYVSFAYNVGGAAFCSSTLVKKLNAGDYVCACNELPRWVYAGGQRLRGLEIRREQERRMCLGKPQ
ncbi:MAG: lysozyme [Burkholderiales bacterium]|jgi:lysozyme|nr:lysozyme [Burkholderiales bacterium]